MSRRKESAADVAQSTPPNMDLPPRSPPQREVRIIAVPENVLASIDRALDQASGDLALARRSLRDVMAAQEQLLARLKFHEPPQQQPDA